MGVRITPHFGTAEIATATATAESPQISTRWPQTPDKWIRTLCPKFVTHYFLWFCVAAVSDVSFHGQDRCVYEALQN